MLLRVGFLFIFILSASLHAEDILLPKHIMQIDGNKHIKTELLYDALDVDTNSFLTFWRDDTPRIKDKLIPTLALTLKSFYASEGFHDATFTIDENNSTVHININENKPIRVTKVEIKSDFDISKLIVFRKNDILRTPKFISIKNTIIRALLAKGHCSYSLDTKAYVDLYKHTAKLKYVLSRGDYCIFGEPNIQGLQSIDKEIILSRIRTVNGERFDPQRVKDTYISIYELNSFDAVQVSVDRKFYNVVPIDIDLSEVEDAYHFEVGTGYDTYVGPRVHTSIVKRNFFGNAKEAGVKLSWSKREQQAVGHFYKPMLFSMFGYGIDFGTEFGYQNLEYRGFQEAKNFWKIYLEHNEGRLKLRVGLGMEDINIEIIDNLRKNELLKQAIREGDFLLIYPYVNVIYDARDDKLNPKYGYYLEMSLEYGLPYKVNASTYIKTLLEARVMHTYDDLTLSAVGKIGVIDKGDNPLPESKLFFAGGSFLNRAYGFNGMGIIESKTSDSISGAYSMLNLSLEANHPIEGNLYGAVFTDNTILTGKSYDFSGHIITSLGIGVRYVTPIGPFKLDVGFNVNDPSQYGISFQIGQSF
jgi:translocation and assembly module TamA